ncbi:MAG: nucleotidyltransferase family protein [Magnetococcales bacterium]|nr:nucleotidyltransferase family protein [Magnetococcales bacterium]
MGSLSTRRQLVYMYHLLSPHHVPGQNAQPVLAPEEWTPLWQRAVNAFLGPALHDALQRHQPETPLDDDILGLLAYLSDQNLIRNQHLKKQTIELIGHLNQQGIKPMLIKGSVALFQPIFPSPAMRCMLDIDFLIQDHERRIVFETMEKLGYTPGGEDFYPGFLESDYFGRHLPLMNRAGEMGAMEAHVSLCETWRENDPFEAEALWQSAFLHQTDGIEYHTLSADNELLFSFFHSQYLDHSHRIGALPLKNLHHFAWLLHHYRDDLNVEALHARLQTVRMLRAFQSYLTLAQRLNLVAPHLFPAAKFPSRPLYYHRATLQKGFPRLEKGLFFLSEMFEEMSSAKIEQKFRTEPGRIPLWRTRWRIAADWLKEARRTSKDTQG